MGGSFQHCFIHPHLRKVDGNLSLTLISKLRWKEETSAGGPETLPNLVDNEDSVSVEQPDQDGQHENEDDQVMLL